MAIPTYDQFIWPLLKFLASRPDGVRSSQVYEALAREVGLTDPEQAQLLPSGRQAVFHNRIGWAHDRLKRQGLSSSVTRGHWRISEDGLAFVTSHPKGLDEHAIAELAHVASTEESETVNAEMQPGSAPEPTASPEEQIDRAMRELNESLTAELLDAISKLSPSFFERLVLDVLSSMGYGADRSYIEQTGKSGDGGIDGLISLDRLGLEKVAVQAKRWKEKVGRPEVQAFYGALAGHRVRKGVFITTSSFTPDATKYAASLSDAIVLVDGQTLAKFMIEYGVGVAVHRAVKIARIDTDYFEE